MASLLKIFKVFLLAGIIIAIKTAAFAQDQSVENLEEITGEEEYVKPDCYWKECFGIVWRTPDLSKVRTLSPNKISEQNRWPIHYAVLNCSPKAVFNILALKGATINLRDPNTGLTPLQTALVLCSRGTISTLLELGADVNEEYVKGGGTTLHFAINKGLPNSILKLLINNTNDLDKLDNRGYAPLIYFLSNGDLDLVHYLLDAGASPNVKDVNGYTPVHFAAESRDIELLRKLRNLGADFSVPTKKGRTALHMLAAKGITPEEIALFRYAEEIDPNYLDSEGRAPIHYAAAQTTVESIVGILVLGVPPDLQDSNGDTPLHYALRYNPDPKVIKALLRVGANPNFPSSTGEKPTMIAIQSSDDITVVDYLVEAGATPNIADENGRTLLHHAIMAKNSQIADKLVEKGADPYLADKMGYDAFKLADIYEIGDPLASRLYALIQKREEENQAEIERLEAELIKRQQEINTAIEESKKQREERNIARRRGSENTEKVKLRTVERKKDAAIKRYLIAQRNGNERLIKRYQDEISQLDREIIIITERLRLIQEAK